MNKLVYAITLYVFLALFVGLILEKPTTVFSQASSSNEQNQRLDSTHTDLSIKLAPGEFLPVSIKLSNFGGGKRVDVLLVYQIISESGVEIYNSSETVAVETTSSFARKIQIPQDTPPGIYKARTSITYEGQEAPATTEFSFNIERKFLGLFQSELFLYGAIAFSICILTALIVYVFAKRRNFSRFGPIDYSNIPDSERVFYELISDTVLGMRQKVGDRAFEIVSIVEGVLIDEKTGRIIKLTRSPSRIIAELVLGYEKMLGKKVSFSFRNDSIKKGGV